MIVLALIATACSGNTDDPTSTSPPGSADAAAPSDDTADLPSCPIVAGDPFETEDGQSGTHIEGGRSLLPDGENCVIRAPSADNPALPSCAVAAGVVENDDGSTQRFFAGSFMTDPSGSLCMIRSAGDSGPTAASDDAQAASADPDGDGTSARPGPAGDTGRSCALGDRDMIVLLRNGGGATDTAPTYSRLDDAGQVMWTVPGVFVFDTQQNDDYLLTKEGGIYDLAANELLLRPDADERRLLDDCGALLQYDEITVRVDENGHVLWQIDDVLPVSELRLYDSVFVEMDRYAAGECAPDELDDLPPCDFSEPCLPAGRPTVVGGRTIAPCVISVYSLATGELIWSTYTPAPPKTVWPAAMWEVGENDAAEFVIVDSTSGEEIGRTPRPEKTTRIAECGSTIWIQDQGWQDEGNLKIFDVVERRIVLEESAASDIELFAPRQPRGPRQADGLHLLVGDDSVLVDCEDPLDWSLRFPTPQYRGRAPQNVATDDVLFTSGPAISAPGADAFGEGFALDSGEALPSRTTSDDSTGISSASHNRVLIDDVGTWYLYDPVTGQDVAEYPDGSWLFVVSVSSGVQRPVLEVLSDDRRTLRFIDANTGEVLHEADS